MHDITTLRTALAGPLSPLTSHRQFVLWRLESNERGQPTKVPLSVSGGYASSTNPATWCDAETALTYANAWGCGVGFVLTDADPFRVIDIDHCYANGQWSQLAHQVCGQFPGAAVEISQSGEGLHVWLTGALPERHSNKSIGLELYANQRFIALTGAGVQPGTSAAIDCPQLQTFVAQYFPPRQTAQGELHWYPAAIPEAGNVPQDDELFLQAFLSAPPSQPRPDAQQAFAHLQTGKDATQIERVPVSNRDLFEANVAVLSQAWPSTAPWGYDKSDAAFSLACRLAYWTGKDCPRIERLMNRAAFQRTFAEVDRVRGQTYMQFDVMRGCLFATNVRKWNADAVNAEVKQQGASGYSLFYDRIASAGDIHTIKAIAEEVGYDLSIDKDYRELLAGHVHARINLIEGVKLPIADCRKMVALRAAHPTPDLKEWNKRENIALNLPQETVLLAPVMTTAQMLDEFVLIADGAQVGSVYNNYLNYALPDFRNLLAASRTVVDGSTIEHTQEWLRHPARKVVATRTFHAGGNVITADPAGRTALNLWRPVPRGDVITRDIQPFIDHVFYLFGNDSHAFLDWLAHIEQKPGELPHFGWLHIADKFGTGRGLLSALISRLWRPYVAPSVDMDQLIGGGFNGAIAGKVIAIVDEVRAGAGENAYMNEGKIRNMLTEETRSINPKYGRAYLEHNACRWLLFSNHKNAIPMSAGDRRWYVVHLGAEPRDKSAYSHLYALRHDPQFIESIGVWLRQRDLSAFNPGERPPVTEAKRKAVEASMSDYQRVANLLVKHWPCDFISVADLANVMYEGDHNGKRMTAAMKHALMDCGAQQIERQIYDDLNNKQRVWVIRNVDQWLSNLAIGTTAPEFAKLRPHLNVGGHATLMAQL